MTSDALNGCYCLCEGDAKEMESHLFKMLVSCLSVKTSGEVTVFFQWCSDVESVRKLCTCVKHLQQFQLKANMFFFIQYCSWWLWYPLVAVLYLMVKASQPKASVCYKQQNVSWYMVVYHIVIVLYMSMDSHTTWENSINWGGNFVLVYLSVFWIDLKSKTGLVINVSGLYAHKH